MRQNQIEMNQQNYIEILHKNAATIRKDFEVNNLWVFGSVARGDNRQDSDIDILVDMPPRMLLVSSLKSFLEGILHTSVDLVRRHSHLSTKFLTQISDDVIPVL